MALLPEISILFDVTALLAVKSLDWQEFSRLGECFVPEVILEQMKFMCDRASEPETEAAAREFNRFFPESGWKKINTQAEHPTLKPAPGHALSKRARISLDVLKVAYGIALRYPDRLIVLVANDQAMLQQVLGLQTKNLCGMPTPALLQWARSQRRPPVVNHHLQQTRSGPTNVVGEPTRSKARNQPATSPTTRSGISTQSTASNFREGMYTARRQRSQSRSRQFFHILSNLVSLAILLIVIATIWRLVSPTSFDQFWQKLPVFGSKK